MTVAGVERFLDTAVGIATDGKHRARQPQREFIADAYTALRSGSDIAAALPTGIGKSLVALSLAGYLATEHGERTVISTETLALQAQYAEKDAVSAVDAAWEISRDYIKVAVVKGYSNYACGIEALKTAQTELGFPPPQKRISEQTLLDAKQFLRKNRKALAKVVKLALDGGLNHDIVTKDDWKGAQQLWEKVSISSEDCLQRDCPLIEVCSVKLARKEAARADVIITNHSVLASQAAYGTSTFSTGRPESVADRIVVHNILVDEAHALASAVRGQATKTITEKSITRLVRDAEAVLPVLTGSPTSQAGNRLGIRLTDVIRSYFFSQFKGNVPPVSAELRSEDHVPSSCQADLERLAVLARQWQQGVVAAATPTIDAAAKQSGNPMLDEARRAAKKKAVRILARVETVIEVLEVGVVGKVGTETAWFSVEEAYSPWSFGLAKCDVDASKLLSSRVWELADVEEVAGTRTAVGRLAMSATLYDSSLRDIGFVNGLHHKSSPFMQAYERSRLFIPSADEDFPRDFELTEGARSNWMELSRHPAWAEPIILRLIEATPGGVLVLSPTIKTAQRYRDYVQAAKTGRTILSQWDALPLKDIQQQWRDDEGSVLFGTNSLMTGLDAPGPTCSLVILDRIPYAGKSGINTGRKQLVPGSEPERRLQVNVTDACILIEQSLGRLIRQPTDVGMFAFLDPRIPKVSFFSKSVTAAERDMYRDALSLITRGTPATSDLSVAEDWLRNKLERQRWEIRQPNAALSSGMRHARVPFRSCLP